MKSKKWMVLGLLILVIAGAGAWVVIVKFEWEKPTLQLLPDTKYLGPKMNIKAEDQKSGLAELKVEIVQFGKTIPLLQEQFPKGTHRVEKSLAMRPLPQGLKDGEIQVRVYAKDYSWNKGNPVTLERNLILDTTPPRLASLSGQNYANQGGTGFITYQSSKEVPASGVQIGDALYPGYSWGKNMYQAYFAVRYDAPPQTPVAVTGEDLAGNRGRAGVPLVIKTKAFKKDKIQISDQFLNHIIPYFKEQNPNLQGEPIDIFLALNQKQRAADHEKIQKLCQNTHLSSLWAGSFLRLPNSKPMAGFAEFRTYWYNGRQIDQQIHLGIDLASTLQSPVPAANAGTVAFAGPLGIYGNSVLIDHGCGLFSMYSHLSSIEAEVKKEVKKGDILGRTGTTGMAGGDHHHFSMLVQGVFVNPIEWWDGHWIKDNIEKKMKN
jgi:murein DD-endopeptidase MepM/ murein hydrolase activator NlpD